MIRCKKSYIPEIIIGPFKNIGAVFVVFEVLLKQNRCI